MENHDIPAGPARDEDLRVLRKRVRARLLRMLCMVALCIIVPVAVETYLLCLIFRILGWPDWVATAIVTGSVTMLLLLPKKHLK